mmetsp:Transcript_13930/g.32669  ORF Transcript_13930/g.32669 Transcript_13930/m.32669 type:complete len:279 (-) Transcript_13930:182-1018(-)
MAVQGRLRRFTAGLLFSTVQTSAVKLSSPELREHAPQGKEDACVCLPWKQVYSKRGVVCGSALEYFFATKTGTPWATANQMLGDEFCRRFFQQIPERFCLNVDMNNAPGQINAHQWCYVSPSCSHLNGGRPVLGTDASWKLCNEGDDDLLRSRSPEELNHLRGLHGLALGLLAKFAYPVWQGERWPAVQHLLLGQNRTELLAGSVRSDLQQLVASSKPMLFDSPSGHPPFHVVAGARVYKIDFTPSGHKAYRLGHMGNVTGLQCMQACSHRPEGAAAL